MFTIPIDKKCKLEIINTLATMESELFKNISPLEFFDSILNLRILASEDPRYQDAYGDLNQHYINNNDWTLEYILLERFDFLKSDELFTLLLNTLVSPSIMKIGVNEISYIYNKLNPILIIYNIEYQLNGHDENNIPIYELSNFNNDDEFKDIKNNNIPFIIKNNKNKENEYFKLIEINWNDFGRYNKFLLSYYKNQKEYIIGDLKIISKEDISTTNEIKNNFFKLDNKYCSLGQKFEYYENIFNIFKGNALSILKALNDVAFFTKIQESFEHLSQFKDSLIRYDEQEQLLRQARHRIRKYDLSQLYSFKYIFKPDYIDDEDKLKLTFNFNDKSILKNRVYALIGNNGVGKTQLVSKLPCDIANDNKNLFSGKVPLFSKIIAVSYSIFDKFSIPENSSKINYIYCGLRKKIKTKKVIYQKKS